MTETFPTTGHTLSPKAALIVAHPGHELRVFHWMENHHPLYFCITDGSGREGESRTGSSARLLERVGAKQGSIFGWYTDMEIYQFLLEGRHENFTGLLKELAEGLIAEDVRIVAGDAPEGANPTHDLCRHLIDNAVAVAERVLGHRIANYEFVLDSPPNDCPPELRSSAVWVHLDEAALDRKLEAALAYTELRGETEEGLKYYGKKAFSIECLIPSTTRTAVERFEHEAPAYERYGREGVERFGKSFGKYEEVITFQKHVKPAVRAIEEAARDFAPAT